MAYPKTLLSRLIAKMGQLFLGESHVLRRPSIITTSNSQPPKQTSAEQLEVESSKSGWQANLSSNLDISFLNS